MTKNLRFLIFVCAVALLGGVNLALSGRFNFLLVYLFAMGVSIPCTYFNYSVCKRGNRWATYWTHKNPPTDNEPSALRLFRTKCSFWTIYCLCLFLSAISTFL